VNYLSRAGVALSLFAGIITVAAASGPISGVWHGHITIDTSKLPPMTDPTQKQMVQAQIKAASQVKVTLTLKGDKTFSVVTTGGPKAQPPTNGTYTATATSVTIKPSGKTKTQSFTVSKDGKTLSMSQGPVTVTFVR
jgi:hypothetical protein